MTKLEICEREKEDEAAWDAYVYNSPPSTFYHQQRSVLIKLFKSLMWRNVVEKTYKHKPLYPIAKEEGEVKGVLPLFLMRSLVFGKKRVSVPFALYGGGCADNETVENAIVEEAKRITKERGVDYFEFRYLHSQEHKSGLATNNHYVTFILNLNQNPDIVWEKFNNKVRNAIRKALNSNLEIKMECSDEQHPWHKNWLYFNPSWLDSGASE